MKKIVLFIALIIGVISISCPLDAKTTVKKKKTTTTTSISLPIMNDGYADITGHSYHQKSGKNNSTLTFKAHNEFVLKLNNEKAKGEWRYLGDGKIEVEVYGYTPIYYNIKDNGKSLYNAYSDSYFKLIK